jgi:acyl carrier protein
MGDSIQTRVMKAVVKEFGIDDEDVRLESRLQEDLGADSLDVVQLAMELEEEFNLEIHDDDTKALATVQDIVDYIERRCAARA